MATSRTAATTTALIRDARPLTFLYPRSARRLLHSTAPRSQANDDPNSLLQGLHSTSTANRSRIGSLFQKATGAASTTTAPPSSTTSSPPPYGSSPTNNPDSSLSSDWSGQVNRTKNAFYDIDKILHDQLSVQERKQSLRSRTGPEPVNPEIYRFQPPLQGNTYVSPKDFSFEEYQKHQKVWRTRTKADFFEQLKSDPMQYYKNFNLLKDFQTTHGRIKHRSLTGLSNVNQRKVSKAIRRAVGIGLLPSVYRHPEVLSIEQINEKKFGRNT